MFALSLLVFAVVAVHGHMSAWTKSMYGVVQGPPTPAIPSGTWEYVNGDPVAPIGPGVRELDQWWFRGPQWRATKPPKGSVTLLPAGQAVVLEIACHVAWTSLGWRETVPGSALDACPDNVGAYHTGDPDAAILDENDLSGCALAIADVDAIEKVTWDNLVVFSVQSRCVMDRKTAFEVPAAMPACSGEKCVCAWFWLANKGLTNFYMTGFDCSVTGARPDAPRVAAPNDAIWCPAGNQTCVQTAGAKRPLYAYNYPSNVQSPGNVDRPGYHASWGFKNGAQNDIFVEPAAKFESKDNVLAAATATTTTTTTTVVATTQPTTTTSAQPTASQSAPTSNSQGDTGPNSRPKGRRPCKQRKKRPADAAPAEGAARHRDRRRKHASRRS